MNIKIAVVKVSPRASLLKSLYVHEHRSDGWVRAGEDRWKPWSACWFAPHNVLQVVEVSHPDPAAKGYDYNGIEPGTLVEYWANKQGIVISRHGTQYTVMELGGKSPYPVDWSQVRPVETPDVNGATEG
jgi:hypothetical protein